MQRLVTPNKHSEEIKNRYRYRYSNRRVQEPRFFEHLFILKLFLTIFLFNRYTKHRFQLHHVFESQVAKEKDSLFDLSSYKLGSQREFYPMLNEIEKQLEDCAGKFRNIVRDHFPRVSDGLACMLLHSLIQLGEYCMSMKFKKVHQSFLHFSDQIVGLCYSCCCCCYFD